MTEKLVNVAETNQLPSGARKLCAVGDRRIALFDLNGTIHAIDNHCTHRDGPVGAGELDDSVITCRWHGWRVNVANGQCLEPDGWNLRQYTVKVQGHDVLIDFAATQAKEAGQGIYCYLVRYGLLGHISRVGSNRFISCRRGDQVVIHTDRGLETGEVLETPSEVAGELTQQRPAGELLRVVTEEDQRQLENRERTDKLVLQRCQGLLAERDCNVTAVDAELLFDAETIIVYYLGEHTDKLGPIAVELGQIAVHQRVQFVSIDSDAPTGERR